MTNSDTVNPEAVEFEEADEEQISVSYERDRFTEAVVSASDWTTETILSQLDRGNVSLSPRFQRRDAWTRPRKSRFIESLIMGLPIPQIVLAERRGERGKYIVLDGKQRLLSLLQFVGKAEGKHNAFNLSGLEVADELEGKSFTNLKNDPNFSEQLDAFLNQTIRAVVIRNWPDMNFLHLVFLRLNTGSVKLSPQELRQAMFPGDFSDYVDEKAVSSPTLKKILKIEEPDFRMRDVELLVRYLAFKNFLEEYRGEIKKFLDDTCERLNARWMEEKDLITSQIEEFEEASKTAIEIFGEHDVARRPKDAGGRRAFNRAIFDVLVFYFSIPRIRNKARGKPEAVKDAFNNLWNNNPEFIKSVESTTKSITATHTRLAAWGEKLKETLDIKIDTPQIEENRIKIN